MNKRRWLYAVFGLVFYLLFLIIEIPASWFAWALNYYSHNTVRLDPLSGSLWHGKGRLVIYYPQTVPNDFGQTEWYINPLWLFAGHVQLSLQANHQDRQIKTTLVVAGNSFMLKNTEAEFPAAFVAQLYTPLSLISPHGKVRITTNELMVTPEKMEGTAALEWLNSGSSLSSVQPLGDYRLDITGTEKNANLKLTTLHGDLELIGQGQWQPQTGQVQINGSALPHARASELESLLNMIGPDQGNGRRALNINTRLPPVFPPNPSGKDRS